ncbi:MAG: hypothetical protein QXY25_03095 [Candidatus Nitrosotenuis sp.]
MLKVERKDWGRHKRLLADPDVKRWYDNMARGSTITADVRLRRLGVYCENTNMTPKEFAQIGIKNVRDVEDLLMDYVSFLEKSGYAPSYIEDVLKALRSWLSFNYVKLVRKIKIKNADIPITLENEEISSKSKLVMSSTLLQQGNESAYRSWHLQDSDQRCLATTMVMMA